MFLTYKTLGWGANCYILADPETKQAAVFDPGDDDPWVDETLQRNGFALQWIVLTHAHCDHIAGLEALRARYPHAPVLAHPAEVDLMTSAEKNFSWHFGRRFVCRPPDRLIHPGETLRVGNSELKVLDVSGHSPGGLAFYTPGAVIVGDALFAGSIGRTDFPGASFGQLFRNIRGSLLPLPPETKVYPGHGEPTTIGDEAAMNPFLQRGG